METSYFNTTDEGLFDLLSDNVDFEFSENPYIFAIPYDCVGRPDKISLIFYQTDDYWWLISKANGFRLSFNSYYVPRRNLLKAKTLNVYSEYYQGRNIKIPTITDINNHLNILTGS